MRRCRRFNQAFSQAQTQHCKQVKQQAAMPVMATYHRVASVGVLLFIN